MLGGFLTEVRRVLVVRATLGVLFVYLLISSFVLVTASLASW